MRSLSVELLADRSDSCSLAVTITSLIALPNPPTSNTPPPWTPRRPSYTPNGTSSPNSTSTLRTPTKFVMLMSDGRAYLVSWAPPLTEHTPKPPSRRMSNGRQEEPEVLFDEKRDEEEQRRAGEKWRWEGVCFHPERKEEGELGEQKQEKELDKGKGGSTIGANDEMGLVAVGCEE